MRSMSGVGLGLSLIFVCLLLALVAELYYMLWWKKRVPTHRSDIEEGGTDNNIFCWKKPSSSLTSTTALNPQQQQLGSSIKIRDTRVEDEDGDESEMMMKLCGPPRFLFTIKEETMEDLESEDGNLMIMVGFETPFMTPLSSPPFLTPPLTPLMDGFNPLYESSSTDAVFSRIRSSPPPKFKFLQDAEEKLYRKQLMIQQDEKKCSTN